MTSSGDANAAGAVFRGATLDDIPTLVDLARDFYKGEHLAFDRERLQRLMSALLSDESLGRLIVFIVSDEIAGYMVIGFGFSLEFGGRDALIDEFYVRPANRGAGIGEAAILYAFDLLSALGISYVHLEADYVNTRVHEFYRRLGFFDHPRHLMTRKL